ncbi:UDP-galactopyranose mutase [Sphingomonas bacterium]|uniref:UDP-galactopyranose mutase n=1 Tax=Sphingomonas bacterium TaxID=1895847 RepID=UPI001575DD23|nr:UDP-galactopyranose mutase [Sphingomonas bacterium]
MRDVDYVIVGAGLTGATIARILTDAGRSVCVLEARDRVGGNVADVVHPCGIRFNLHGPHYFRTSSARIEAFVTRFARFYPFSARVMTRSGGELFDWPLHKADFDRLTAGGDDPAEEGADTGPADNFETRMLSLMPRRIYRRFVHGYTTKQWGVAPSSLDPGLASRLEIREDGDVRLSRATFQALPYGGFTGWIEKMLDGIEVLTGRDHHTQREVRWRRRLVYTGSIDRYFDYVHGQLPYRTQRRDHRYLPGRRFVQPCGQINIPGLEDGPAVRTVEWNHMLEDAARPAAGTLLTTETPGTAGDWTQAEYPFPSSSARSRYEAYLKLAGGSPDVLFCGRLGEYRYLDMDQAIGRAMVHASRLLEGS